MNKISLQDMMAEGALRAQLLGIPNNQVINVAIDFRALCFADSRVSKRTKDIVCQLQRYNLYHVYSIIKFRSGRESFDLLLFVGCNSDDWDKERKNIKTGRTAAFVCNNHFPYENAIETVSICLQNGLTINFNV